MRWGEWKRTTVWPEGVTKKRLQEPVTAMSCVSETKEDRDVVMDGVTTRSEDHCHSSPSMILWWDGEKCHGSLATPEVFTQVDNRPWEPFNKVYLLEWGRFGRWCLSGLQPAITIQKNLHFHHCNVSIFQLIAEVQCRFTNPRRGLVNSVQKFTISHELYWNSKVVLRNVNMHCEANVKDLLSFPACTEHMANQDIVLVNSAYETYRVSIREISAS